MTFQQPASRFQNAPKVNFFLQTSLAAFPGMEGPSPVESKPLLRVLNLLFQGVMVSSAFGLYAHASLNEMTTVPAGGESVTGSLPSYEMAIHSEPLDKSRPLKPLTETVQQLAVIDEVPDLLEGVRPNTAQDKVKQLLNQPEPPTGPVGSTGALGLVSPTIGGQSFTPDIDESALIKPAQSPQWGEKPAASGKKATHARSAASANKAKRVADKSPYDFEPDPSDEPDDEDQKLLNKILAKPRIAVGLPQALPKPHPLPNVDDFIGKPESRFGTRASVIESATFMSPLRRLNVSSRYGWRYGRMHSGIDLAAPIGSDILAAKGGVVVYSGWQGGYGKTIIIDHGDGRQTRYAHCHRLFVSEGQRVSQGDRIALVGNTGHSTGSHLHFEVLVNGIARNPENFLFR